MFPSPRVSVVIPFRDEETHLPECLASLRGQSLVDHEQIWVDDGSRDGGPEILRRAAREDGRIRLVTQPRLGIVAALNRGLDEARAPLVARMDADDRALPHRLLRQVEHLEAHADLDVLGCGVRLFPPELVRDGYRAYVDWLHACVDHDSIADERYVESPLAHPTVCFRRDVILAHGGYAEGPFPEDYELWLRLLAAGRRFARLPEVLLEWRERPERASRTDPRCGAEAFARLRLAHLARDPRLHGPRPLVFWGAGRSTRRRSLPLREAGLVPRFWIDVDPKKIGNRVDGLPVRAPEVLVDGPRPFVLIWVRGHGVRSVLEARIPPDYRRGRDYLFVG